MRHRLALAGVALALLLAGCGSGLAPIPPRSTPSPIVLTTALPDAWTALQQVPLHIPTLSPGEPCPVAPVGQVNPNLGDALGTGPAFLVGFGKAGALDLSQASQQNGAYSVLTLLTAPPAYTTDMLVRGRQMDGAAAVLFSEETGSGLLTQLQLSPDTAGTTGGASGGWLTWSAFLVVSGAGCYGLQIDGAGFSEVIVFQITKG
ncbi:MAG TPA: hypothetical protein VFU32_07725 [Ktedonobacterales bacterium]|nr:hypothetical protein [Ktedonobacterales bacterium]